MLKKILVVDDSRTVRLEVKAALVPAGYEVVEAVDGQNGMEQIAAHGDLAMMICDVNMPRMNGVELVARMNAGRSDSRLPVLMMTTEGSATLIRQAKDAGATAWIVKPFRADQLVSTVGRLAR